jgi:hypothetical protein
MRTKTYHANSIKDLLVKQKIATMSELQTALGTHVNMTVIRKLQKLSYHSSYSHRGKYYTLDEIADFDSQGLWSFESVLFSRYGTLMQTVKDFVNNCQAGFSARELESLLHLAVKEPLFCLYRRDDIHRQKISGCYVYFSSEPKTRKRQLLMRKDQDLKSILIPDSLQSELLAHELKAAIVLFFTMLDEKQRRIYAGLESLKIGYGGDRQIANLFGIDAHTVAKGRSQLLSQDFEPERVRKKGGGRIFTGKKNPKS